MVPITLGDFVNGGDPNAAVNFFSEYVQNFPTNQNVPIRIYQVGGYIQDDWKVNANLTISPALRVEHSSNPICVTNCFGQFAVPFSDVVADPTAPYNEQLAIGRRNALLSLRAVQWEPRISFAWQPFGSSNEWWKKDFVIRGGAGIFNDIFPGQIADSMASNPPLVNPFTLLSPAAGGTCPGFLSPNQAGNFTDCASAANAAFNTTFFTGGNTTTFAPSVTYTPPVIVPAQYQKWSLDLQKGFGANDSIYVGYFGNHGIHEPIINNSVNAFGLVNMSLPRLFLPLNLDRLRRFPAQACRITMESLLPINTASRCGAAACFNLTTYTAMRSTLSRTVDSTRSWTIAPAAAPPAC